MGFLDNIFRGRTAANDAPENRAVLELARQMEAKRSVLLDLSQQTESLTKKDVGVWLAAWQMAINKEEPRRTQLYGCYTQALIDAHLTGCITQRKGRTLQKNFVIKGKDGKENDGARRYFENEWFVQFCDLALDKILWGHSLIQMGDVVGRGTEGMRFDGCVLVPRRHVLPEFGVITKEVGGDIKKGIPYREGEFADWCVEVGDACDLGVLLKVTPQCLSKKNMIAYWDTFGEIFGMPMRIGYTPSQNRGDWSRISTMLQNMGAAGWALLPEGTNVEIKETTRGDAYNVYDKRIDRANSEISKAILGQTMTIDSGSSLSQSETHLEVFNNICKGDATSLRYTINSRLLPLMERHGFAVGGCTFEWDEAASYTPAEQRENERMLLQYFDIPAQYFIDKYKIDITGVKQPSQSGFFQ